MSTQLDEWDTFLKDCDRSLDELKAAATKASRVKATREGRRDLKRIERDIKVVSEWKAEAIEKRDEVAHWHELAKTAPPAATFQEYPIPNVNRGGDPHEELRNNRGRLTETDVRSIAASAVEREHSDFLSDDHKESATNVVEGLSPKTAEYVAVVSGKTYRDAFQKVMTNPFGASILTPEEGHALTQARALNYGTSGDGGYGVPLALDPSIIIANAGVNNPVRLIADNVKIDSQKWQGVTSAGSTASWDAELAEVSDDSPTLVGPEIETEKLAVWVPYSLEVAADYPNFAQEIQTVMLDAVDRAEATAFVTGSGPGSTQPTGIVTELDGGSYENTSPAVAESFTVADVWATASALPERYWSDPSCAWLAHRSTSFEIRQFADGASQGAGAFWAELGVGNPPALIGKPIYDSSVLPSASDIDAGATATNTGVLLIGAWRNFKVVDRVGVTVVPSGLTLGSNRRPDGGMGFYMYKRVGAGSVNDAAFYMLSVPTTA